MTLPSLPRSMCFKSVSTSPCTITPPTTTVFVIAAQSTPPGTCYISTSAHHPSQVTSTKESESTHLPAPDSTTTTTRTSSSRPCPALPTIVQRMIRAPALLRRGVPPQHEHRLPALLVQLLEEQQRLLFQPEAALLVAMHNVQRVLPPVVGDVVAFEGLRDRLAWE